MLTARKIAQIGTFPRWWCGIGPAGAIGGAAVPYLGRRRRRIGFSSRTLPTDGGDPPTVVVCWLARSVVGWEEESVPRPIGIYGYLLGALGESNTSRALFSFRAFFPIAGSHHPVLLPFFHPPINNRRTPCLWQHCRCQRCRQDHPGHWCRCRRSGEFN